MKNLLIFVKCCLINKITLCGYILVLLSLIFYFLNLKTLSFLSLIYGIVALTLSFFGLSTFLNYKRSYENFKKGNMCAEPYAYCASVGYKIALKEIKKACL